MFQLVWGRWVANSIDRQKIDLRVAGGDCCEVSAPGSPLRLAEGSMICPRSFNDVVTQPDHWQEPVSNRHSLPAFQVGPGFEEGHGWVRELERLVIEHGKQKTV